MAILGTIPVMTAPSPLYRANGVSRFTISLPVVRNPRRFAWLIEYQMVGMSTNERRRSIPQALVPFVTVAFGP